MDESRVTRDDILKFPFPYKLWVIVNLPAADFLCWTFDGDGIIIYNKKLQGYLQSQQSIFVIKTAGQFVQHLLDFQFKSEELDPTTEVVLYFYHPCFKRKRLDLVSKIRRTSFFNLQDAQCAELEAAASIKTIGKTKASGKDADMCSTKFGVMTKAKMSSIQASTLAAFTRESKILQEKLKINEELVRKNSNKRGRSACLARLRSVELSESIYANPYESTLAGTKVISGNGYAGFYGNYSKEQLKSFFGYNLPKYDENGILTIEKQGSSEQPSDATKPKSSGLVVNNADDPLLSGNGVAGAASIDFTVNRAGEIFKKPINQACEMEVADHFAQQNNEILANNTESASSNIAPQPVLTFALQNGSINANVEVGYPTQDFKMGNPLVMDQNVQNAPPSQPIQDNQDFYDDLRATFELLQNQDF